MRAGTLRDQIVIESRTDAADSFGQPIPTWSTFATVWAAVEPSRGREFFASQALTATDPVRFRLRYLPGLTAAHRIQYGGKVYDIAAVEDVMARTREHHVYAETGLTRG